MIGSHGQPTPGRSGPTVVHPGFLVGDMLALPFRVGRRSTSSRPATGLRNVPASAGGDPRDPSRARRRRPARCRSTSTGPANRVVRARVPRLSRPSSARCSVWRCIGIPTRTATFPIDQELSWRRGRGAAAGSRRIRRRARRSRALRTDGDSRRTKSGNSKSEPLTPPSTPSALEPRFERTEQKIEELVLADLGRISAALDWQLPRPACVTRAAG